MDLVPGWILSLKDRRQAPICLGGLKGGWEKGYPVGNFKPFLSASTRQMIGLGGGDRRIFKVGAEKESEGQFINPSLTRVQRQYCAFGVEG